jgi:RNA polymerase sigma factor (TIGR02999 family)
MTAGSENPAHMNELLSRARGGDRTAYDLVFADAYRELQDIARLARRRLSGATLDTTGLVHECYLRLIKHGADANDVAHFFAIAAQAMRHLLIERARARVALKRAAAVTEVDADEVAEINDARELIEIDDLLRKLGDREPQQAAIVECRFFGGLSDTETATALNVSVRTVQREWSRARAWMAEHSA